MEFGPRALGARSIIGDARSPAMQATMNLKIKFRESFRPFAPVVLQEHAHDWFDMPEGQESPYMLLVAPVLTRRRKQNVGALLPCGQVEPATLARCRGAGCGDSGSSCSCDVHARRGGQSGCPRRGRGRACDLCR